MQTHHKRNKKTILNRLTQIWRVHVLLGGIRRSLSQMPYKPNFAKSAPLYALYFDQYIRDLPRRMRLECELHTLQSQDYAYTIG